MSQAEELHHRSVAYRVLRFRFMLTQAPFDKRRVRISGGNSMAVCRKTISIAALMTVALSSSALAGGFQRGTADTDILFEQGTVNMRAGVTYVSPQRGFDSVNGVSGNFDDYTGDYVIPSYALAFGNETLACAGTATESFAAEADYTDLPGGALPAQVSSTQSTSNVDRLNFATATSTSRTARLAFDSTELGLTCRASYTSEMGRFSLLGGVFFEDFHFEGTSFGQRLPFVAPGVPVASTRVDVDIDGDYQTGYRIGAAYEIPEYALRVQALYRSEVVHDDVQGSGTVTLLNSFIPGLPTGTVLPVSSSLSEAVSPQYLEIKAQTGVAPGWLVLASFRWTDWSTNNASVNTISSPLIGTSSSYVPYHWQDGYTASLGVGHAFNDQISGALSVGYDRGVSTGADTTYTDLYTLAGGLSFKANEWSDLRVGGLVGYWTDGEQSISSGSYYNATVGDDVVYAINASLKLTF
ncbi:outer membrane protein transport protein [Jiella marina]|uniref:outer membrane protein transport protein n=1 Tax=Jiella sp. LLJ827 TaxID=2917712 RepID=UPI00210166F9|nr:outer membrane protein transport protein [Jiella sp. LLJ827]MCQ0987440.1 outer membrane protein transport protein [Jiella sp. LLJ827]